MTSFSMPMMVLKHFTTSWDPSDNFARGPVLELTGFAMAQCPILAHKIETNFPFNMEKLWAFVLQQTQLEEAEAFIGELGLYKPQ